MRSIFREVVAPKSGLAVVVHEGENLRITDLEGQQVVDTAIFLLENPREKLSTSYSRTRQKPTDPGNYLGRDTLTVGHVLLSTLAKPLMTIVEDTPDPKGVHDVHARMCNSLVYELHGFPARDGCLEIISGVVADYGILPEDVPDSIDFFHNHHHSCELGGWLVEEPVSKPGDYVELRAERDVLVAMSNCPEDVLTACNGGHCTPIEVEIFA